MYMYLSIIRTLGQLFVHIQGFTVPFCLHVGGSVSIKSWATVCPPFKWRSAGGPTVALFKAYKGGTNHRISCMT